MWQVFPIWRRLLSKDIDFFQCHSFVTWLTTNFQMDMTSPKTKEKYFRSVLFSRLGNWLPMVTKLILEMRASWKCIVTNHGFAFKLLRQYSWDFCLWNDSIESDISQSFQGTNIWVYGAQLAIIWSFPPCQLFSMIFERIC